MIKINRLKEMRIKKNLSLRDTSKLTNVSFAYLWQLETGKSIHPREGTKILISKGLKIPINELFPNGKGAK